MNIFISGISGKAMGPLALMAKDAGVGVFGSDVEGDEIVEELVNRGIEIKIGEQNGDFLKEKVAQNQVEWFVYTSALPKDHPELLLAKKLGLRISKRDELLSYLIEELGLKMVAVAGTHGKTTTTAMIVWLCTQLGLPISYSVGTTLGFAPSGKYDKRAEYFIYEADEFDRNFLHFHPWLAIITNVSYDHSEIYPTVEDYQLAFWQFIKQSERTIIEDVNINPDINLVGKVRRIDADFAVRAVKKMLPKVSEEQLIKIVNEFPGIGRRFERVADGVYSDYGHHPEEVQAVIETAFEQAKKDEKKGVVVVYEPLQNKRQHKVRKDYAKVFLGVKKLFWLPTFLTREKNQDVLSPEELIEELENKKIAEAAEANENLAEKLKKYHDDNYLILMVAGGHASDWLKELFGRNS